LEDIASALLVDRWLVLAAELDGCSVEFLYLHIAIDHEYRGGNRALSIWAPAQNAIKDTTGFPHRLKGCGNITDLNPEKTALRTR
jgi:hypothetical protein